MPVDDIEDYLHPETVNWYARKRDTIQTGIPTIRQARMWKDFSGYDYRWAL